MTTTVAVAPAKERQPPGLYLLFAVEMWERFSFYGMKAILALFAADAARGGLGWTQASASRLMGIYGFSAYTLPLFGGYLADRYLGTHRSMVIGGFIIAAGHFCLAIRSIPTFFLGLVLVVMGTGFFKSNVSTMVGQLYAQGDARRDSGFTIFYLGVNVGALLGIFACGYLGESARWGWHYGFGAAGVGMLLGLGLYLRLKRRYLGTIGDLPNREMARTRNESVGALSRDERDRLIALLVIIGFTIPFWMAFEQSASSMNFFAKDRTDRVIFGLTLPASWLQNVNSAVLIISAPFFAALWTALTRRGREPSIPSKMILAMLLAGGGFLFMMAGGARSEGGRLVSPLWLVGAYTLLTFGELCLSPTGLSMVTKLAPMKFASALMGVWFFATGISELLAGLLGALTDKVQSRAHFFLIFVVSSAITAVGLLILRPWLKRQMHGRAT